MSPSHLKPDTILAHLTSPVKIFCKPHPYSICAARIFTEICRTKSLQFKLSFETPLCKENVKIKNENDVFIDTLNLGITLKTKARVALGQKNNNQNAPKHTYIEIRGLNETEYGTKNSCHLAFEFAKHLNILPDIVLWSFAVCSSDTKDFEKLLYIPYLNYSTLYKSLQYHAPKQKINFALALNGVSLFEANKIYSHVGSHIKERIIPLFEKFVRQKSNIINKNNMCTVKHVGSIMISAEEHLFSILHYLSIGKPNDAYICIENLDLIGLKVYEKVCEIASSIKVKKISGRRVGFGKEGKFNKSILWMVNEILALSMSFYKGNNKYNVVHKMDAWDIEKYELRDCIKTLLDD